MIPPTPWRLVRAPEGHWQVWTKHDPTPGSKNNFVVADGIQSEDDAQLIAQAPLVAAQLAIHDGCSRWGIRDAFVLRTDSVVTHANGGVNLGYYLDRMKALS